MDKVLVHIGRESSDDELSAIKSAFSFTDLNVEVRADLARMSMDWQQLPMTVIVSAQPLAPKLLWNAMDTVIKTIYADDRLRVRKPTVVVKRRTYDVILTDTAIHTRSGLDTKEYKNLVELADFENSQSKSTRSSGSL